VPQEPVQLPVLEHSVPGRPVLQPKRVMAQVWPLLRAPRQVPVKQQPQALSLALQGLHRLQERLMSQARLLACSPSSGGMWIFSSAHLALSEAGP